MLPLRLTARGCVTAAREGCSKFAFTTPNLRPGTDGIGPVPALFAVGAVMLPIDRDFAPPTRSSHPLQPVRRPSLWCEVRSDQRCVGRDAGSALRFRLVTRG